MPSFSDSIFLFVLALLLFGPKRLPVLARELGKWVGEFRRASNEFKMQMEDELRLTEQADRQKQIAAMEAAAPVAAPVVDSVPLELSATPSDTVAEGGLETPVAEVETETAAEAVPQPSYEMVDGVRTPIPIATSGELSIMPPATGLPTPQRQTSGPRNSALRGLLDAIPAATEEPAEPVDTASAPEITAHGN
jgi:sec-independent protein translocase protein TatB